MREAKEQCAWLEEVDEETFARFMEFLYTGDYPAATHSVILDCNSIESHDNNLDQESRNEERRQELNFTASYRAEEAPVAESAEETAPGTEPEVRLDPWAFGTAHKKDKKRSALPTKLQQAWKRFVFRHMNCVERVAHTVRRNQESCEDYTEVFLSHARLYVLADKYDIEKFRAVSLYKLHQTLCNFTLYEERVRDISCLLEYVYENTAERHGRGDEMRTLVIEFVSCNIGKLVLDELFRTMLKEHNMVSLDLLQRLLERLDEGCSGVACMRH